MSEDKEYNPFEDHLMIMLYDNDPLAKLIKIDVPHQHDLEYYNPEQTFWSRPLFYSTDGLQAKIDKINEQRKPIVREIIETVESRYADLVEGVIWDINVVYRQRGSTAFVIVYRNTKRTDDD